MIVGDVQFTIFLRYPAGTVSPHPFTAILRAHILSVRSPQPRYHVRGTKGSFEKYGVDVQEDQLKAMPTPQAIHESEYGREPEEIWGTLYNLGASGKVEQSVYVGILLPYRISSID